MDLGIDELFIKSELRAVPGDLHPSRMATTTSIGFVFMGLAFLFLAGNHTLKVIGQYLVHLITLLAFIAISGYIFRVPALYKLSFFSSMAIHTSVTFFVLSIALAIVNPLLGITSLFTGELIGSQMARKLFPKMVIAIFLLAALRIFSHEQKLVSVEFGITLFAICFILIGLFLIWNTALLLNKIDTKRQEAENQLVLTNKSLEDMVQIRTAELKLSVEKAQTAEANLRAVFNAAHVSIIETGKDCIVRNFNRGAETLLGYTAAEVVDKMTPDFVHLEEEIKKRGEELSLLLGEEISGIEVFIALARRGMYDARQWTYVRKDGSTFPVQLVVTAITGNRGEIKGFLGIATDISDLEKAKAERELLTVHLQKKNDQLLNFAHVTSHNLRSPVSSLNALMFLYQESDEDEKKTLVGHFKTVVKHLTDTLDELVDSLKIQEDKGREREWLNFEDIFRKISQIFIGAIIESHAVVTADFSKASQISYPRGYLESILLNLFSNALKYRAPDRIPEIHFSTENTNEGVTLKVADNGLGIDLEMHGSELFGLNKTFHGHPEAKGVGLFMTKMQIEAMGGQISAVSEVGKGTTFTILF